MSIQISSGTRSETLMAFWFVMLAMAVVSLKLISASRHWQIKFRLEHWSPQWRWWENLKLAESEKRVTNTRRWGTKENNMIVEGKKQPLR